MVVRVDVEPALLTWARERAALDLHDLTSRFPKLPEWERGVRRPTLKQLEEYANATHAPIGALFLSSPPVERVPIPDYRTFGDRVVRRPSPHLLDTIYICQQRQEWYRNFLRSNGEDGPALVGSLARSVGVRRAASLISEALSFTVNDRQRYRSWSEALRALSDAAEAKGVLVMVSGIVGSNTHRKLDAEEFRGFSLVDRYAPIIFINGADTKAAQIFTLSHELVHIWLGEQALSNQTPDSSPASETERWCNEVAAEFLAPLDVVRTEFQASADLTEELERLARLFRVSTLVVLRRIRDAGYLSQDQFRVAYDSELNRVMALRSEGATGGNYYYSQPVRVSKRFARAVIASTLEGNTLYSEAFHLLGSRKASTFYELARTLEVI